MNDLTQLSQLHPAVQCVLLVVIAAVVIAPLYFLSK